jgi:predicted transcriptional regulator
LSLLKEQPDLAAKEVSQQMGITARAVEKQIAKLRDEISLRRIGTIRIFRESQTHFH